MRTVARRLVGSIRIPVLFIVPWLAAALLGCGGGEDAPEGDHSADRNVKVSAAASLRDVVGDLAAEFEARHGAPVELNFAGSNVLAQQIRATPQADVFLSADRRWVDDLLVAGRLVAGSDRALLGNRLVVVARPDAELPLESLADLAAALTETSPERRLVIADPVGVPAGRYARAYLQADGLWDRIEARVVPALDVRAALALVETDPSLVGIVYRTDAAVSKRVEVLLELPQRPDIDIVYWGALVKKAGDQTVGDSLGAEFLAFLDSPAGHGVASRHGFLPAD